MEICIIAAVAADGAIGKGNRLLWHLPQDLKHFKELTMGCPVIMGRRTFESIGRPLPGRRNIIVSRSLKEKEFVFPGEGKPAPSAEVACSLEDALRLASGLPEHSLQKMDSTPLATMAAYGGDAAGRCFIIGGASLYAEALPLADRLFLTHIDATAPDADRFFPAVDSSVWQEISRSAPQGDSGLSYTFVEYVRTRL